MGGWVEVGWDGAVQAAISVTRAALALLGRSLSPLPHPASATRLLKARPAHRIGCRHPCLPICPTRPASSPAQTPAQSAGAWPRAAPACGPARGARCPPAQQTPRQGHCWAGAGQDSSSGSLSRRPQPPWLGSQRPLRAPSTSARPPQRLPQPVRAAPTVHQPTHLQRVVGILFGPLQRRPHIGQLALGLRGQHGVMGSVRNGAFSLQGQQRLRRTAPRAVRRARLSRGQPPRAGAAAMHPLLPQGPNGPTWLSSGEVAVPAGIASALVRSCRITWYSAGRGAGGTGQGQRQGVWGAEAWPLQAREARTGRGVQPAAPSPMPSPPTLRRQLLVLAAVVRRDARKDGVGRLHAPPQHALLLLTQALRVGRAGGGCGRHSRDMSTATASRCW